MSERDLVGLLREIERRAGLGREAIDVGRRIGQPTNGRSALYAIERLARDGANALEKRAGGPKAARRGTTPSSTALGGS